MFTGVIDRFKSTMEASIQQIGPDLDRAREFGEKQVGKNIRLVVGNIIQQQGVDERALDKMGQMQTDIRMALAQWTSSWKLTSVEQVAVLGPEDVEIPSTYKAATKMELQQDDDDDSGDDDGDDDSDEEMGDVD